VGDALHATAPEDEPRVGVDACESVRNSHAAGRFRHPGRDLTRPPGAAYLSA
jgi:hypothetical protein